MLHRRQPSRKFALTILTAIFFATLPASGALAQSVFINATEVSGTSLRDRALMDVESVRFDSEGNVHIVAPGYNVQVASARNEAPRNADAFELITGLRYLLVLSNPSRGGVPYDIEVIVNGRSVVQWTHTRGNAALDITGYMALGDNEVRIVATRNSEASPQPDARLRVMLGPGEMEGRRASVSTVAAGLEVTGSETDPTRDNSVTFTVETRDEGEE